MNRQVILGAWVVVSTLLSGLGGMPDPVAGAEPGAATFDGKWDTTYGLMTLTQNGDEVAGVYVFKGKEYTLKGTVKDGVLNGKYFQPDSATDMYKEGPLKFTLSEDGTMFKGLFWNKAGTDSAGWNGSRVK